MKISKSVALSLTIHHFVLIYFFSIQETIAYIPPARMHKIIVDSITKSSLKTAPPYIMRYPRPAPETKYSPIIVPTQESPIVTFSADINSPTDEGIISFVSI